MYKNRYLVIFSVVFSINLFVFVSIPKVFASPTITSLLLNNESKSVTFNPNKDEAVSIQVDADVPVKFTRLYICSIDLPCNGTSGNYTRYFTQSSVSNTITKVWNGKKTGDTEIVPAGEYKIMVSMTEGTNDPVLEFGQYSIFVDFSNNINDNSSDSASSTSNENDSSTTTTTATGVSDYSSVSTNRAVYLSSHSATDGLSDYSNKTSFEISAGRERLTAAGSSLNFDSKYSLPQDSQCAPSFSWSFGDGFDSLGDKVSHIYKFPGEYQVVLNGICGNHTSISRTVVNVVLPVIFMSLTQNGDLKLTNNGKMEINIGKWKIKGGQTDFTFPLDTIIASGKSITLSKESLNLSSLSNKISLNNNLDGEVTSILIANSKQQIQPSYISVQSTQDQTTLVDNSISVAEAESLVREYKNKTVSESQKTIVAANDISPTEITVPVPDDPQYSTSTSDRLDQTATVLDSIDSAMVKSFWRKLIEIPINGLTSIAHMFYSF